MSYFDDASLVMIPSGYKTSKVYSVKPTSGDGDLTFTRSNDTATRVNSAGLIEKVRTNLALQSNSFNTTWTPSNASVTSGQAGYDGTTNAWSLLGSGSNARIDISNTSTGLLTFSVYAKAGTSNFMRLRVDYGAAYVDRYFNLSTGALGGTFFAPLDSKIESAGGGWYRCSVTLNQTISTIRVYVADVDLGGSASGNILIQNSQLESGDIATQPILTTTAAVSVGPVANVPRLDYLGSSCPRLLLEPQRQNVCLWSEQIDNAGWTKISSPTITTNIATAPDGYGGADGIQDTTGGAFKSARQAFSVSANSTVTASYFVKKETSETNYGGVALVFSGVTTNVAYSIVDAVNGTATLSTGTIGSASTKIEDYGTYYRVTLTATDSGSNTTVTFQVYGTLSTDGTTTGNSAGSVRTVWGFQVEIGASYATSYIPTLGAAVTRGADACSKTGISSLIGSAAGTIYVEFSALANDLTERRIALSNGTTGNVARVGYTSISNRILAVLFNGTNQCVLSYDGADITQTQKVAFTWAANDFALFVNGVKRASDVSGTTFAANTLTDINFNEGDGAGNEWYGDVDQLLLFKSRLNDDQLAALTA